MLQHTLDIATRMDLSAFVLTKLRDVDRPEDLAVWNHAKDTDESGLDSGLGRGSTHHSRALREGISVVIPALNEAESLPAALASVGRSDEVETIVVDGGSVDETLSVAQSLGAKAIRGSKGRGTQMNRGAAEANGDILLFLHADTRLPPYWADHVRRELAYPGVSGGAFRFRTDGQAWSFRIIECLANLRATWFQMPYGDQALFVRADLFRQMGGFPDLPVMEDFEFVRQVRSRGRVSITHADAQHRAGDGNDPVSCRQA